MSNYYSINIFIAKLVVIILLCCIFDARALHAGVTVQPDSTEIMVSADAVTTCSLQVVNDDQTNVRVKVEPEDWMKKKADGIAVPVSQWLEINPVEFDLGPGEKKKVDYSIKAPNDSGPELVAMVFFSTTAPQGMFNVTSRYGVSIYASIADRVNLDCSLAGVDIKQNLDKTETGNIFKGLIFTLNVENKGNVHIRPTGNIAVRGEDGSLYDLPIYRDFPVYPDSHLEQRVLWNKTDIAPGKYEADISLDYGKLYKLDKKIERKVSFTVNEDKSVSF